MTIEVGLIPEGRDVLRILGHIRPGEAISLSDYLDGDRKVLSIICYPDDSGGEVYRFSNEDFVENPMLRAIPTDMYSEDNRIGSIPAGGKFEREVVSETRRRGRLILTHLSGK